MVCARWCAPQSGPGPWPSAVHTDGGDRVSRQYQHPPLYFGALPWYSASSVSPLLQCAGCAGCACTIHCCTTGTIPPTRRRLASTRSHRNTTEPLFHTLPILPPDFLARPAGATQPNRQPSNSLPTLLFFFSCVSSSCNHRAAGLSCQPRPSLPFVGLPLSLPATRLRPPGICS
jgi:hypothetical protein